MAYAPAYIENEHSTAMPISGGEETPLLAVRDPWAHFIIEGRKTIEIRNGRTEKRGPVGIYVSKKFPTHKEISTLTSYFGALQRKCYDEAGYVKKDQTEQFKELGNWGAFVHNYYSKDHCRGVSGKIIGTVEIIDCKGFSSNIEFKELYDQHLCPSEYVDSSKVCQWILANPVKFEKPIPFDWPSTGSWSKTVLPEGYL